MLKTTGKTPIGCAVLVLIFNLLVGGWSVNQILMWFGKDISAWADILLGVFVAQISFPVAVVGWILRYFGVF